MKHGTMKKLLRGLVLATTAAVALAFANSAFAAYKPSLTVQQGSYKLGAAANPGFLFVTNPNSDDPTAKMTIFSPSGYTHSFAGLTPGATVGKAYALVRAGALGGAILPLEGPVVVGNPSDATLRAASQQCTGSPTSDRILVLNTSLQGQQIQVPDFVNVRGPYVTQQICLPHPSTAAFQAQLILASFTIRGVFANPAATGTYQWVGDFTPYLGTVPNPTGTVEYRTLVGLPSTLTFKRVKFKYLKFVGKLQIHGLNTAGVRLTVYYGRFPRPAPNFTNPSKEGLAGKGRRAAATARVRPTGYFWLARWRMKRTTWFQARFGNYQLQPAGSCQGPSPAGQVIPCLGTDIAPMTSTQVRVLPKKKRHHR